MTSGPDTIWKFGELADSHDVVQFDCGVHALNHWLKKFALQNQQQNLSKTFVALPPANRRVMGFYSVCPGQIDFQSLPKKEKAEPKYSRGVIRLARLAVDKSAHGRGLGSELLVEALLRAYRVSREISTFGVVVDAKEGARDFYLRYEFVPYFDVPSSLFLPMKTIERMLDKVGLK